MVSRVYPWDTLGRRGSTVADRTNRALVCGGPGGCEYDRAMTPGPFSRAARAAVFAALCVLLAATGHVLMSGSAVPWWAIATAFVGTAGIAWGLAGTERGLFGVTAVAVAVQAVLHQGFILAQGSGRAASAEVLPHTAAHHAGHHVLPDEVGGASLEDGSAAVDGMLLTLSPSGMTAAHLLAAVGVGLWLAHGERAAFQLLRTVAAWLWTPRCLLSVSPAVPHVAPVPVRRRRDRSPLRQLLLSYVITSRGPPAGIAVL